jgi:hypothetical protein
MCAESASDPSASDPMLKWPCAAPQDPRCQLMARVIVDTKYAPIAGGRRRYHDESCCKRRGAGGNERAKYVGCRADTRCIVPATDHGWCFAEDESGAGDGACGVRRTGRDNG